MSRINYKPVISIDDAGNETRYPSMKAAADHLGVQQSQITMACTRGHKCYGLRWRKEEPDDGLLTRTQAQVVLGFADGNMCIADSAKLLYLSVTAIKYNIDRIYEKTGKDPKNFYDLYDLVQIAREVLKNEN